MTKVVSKSLPHGVIPFENIADANLKRVVMLNNENVGELKRQLATVQLAVQELQRNIAQAINGSGSGSSGDEPEEIMQVDWQQTDPSAADFIKNKPNSLKNPFALRLTPIDGKGELADEVAYDGSEEKNLTFLTEHQDVSTKIDYPQGGNNNDVLVKDNKSAKWARINFSELIVTQQFSGLTNGDVYPDEASTVTVNIYKEGYTPIGICNICYWGQASSSYYRWTKACFACTTISMSDSQVSFTVDTTDPQGVKQRVNVSFVVIYRKN